jgi:hypothetical protein
VNFAKSVPKVLSGIHVDDGLSIYTPSPYGVGTDNLLHYEVSGYGFAPYAATVDPATTRPMETYKELFIRYAVSKHLITIGI